MEDVDRPSDITEQIKGPRSFQTWKLPSPSEMSLSQKYSKWNEIGDERIKVLRYETLS